MFKRLGLFIVFLVLMFSAVTPLLADSDCDFSYSNHARAAQLHDMGDYTSALQHYECALEQDPDSDILPLMISNVYRDMGEVSQPNICDTDVSHLELGFNLRGRGELETAVQHLECALQENPYDTALWMAIGNIYETLGDTESAEYFFSHDGIGNALYQNLPTSNCETSISHYATGAQSHAMGDLQSALHHYECALEQTPDRPGLLQMMGDLYRDMGDLQTAQGYYDRAGFNQPQEIEIIQAPSNSGKNALPQLDDDFGGDLTVPTTTAEPASAKADTLWTAATAFVGQGKYDLAAQQYEALLGFEPNNPDVHFGLAHSLYALKDYALSLSYFEQTLALNPDHLYATYYLAMTNSQLNNRAEALIIVDELYTSNNYDGTFPLMMAHVYRNLGYADVAGIQFYEWMSVNEILRLPAALDPATNHTELKMDYGLVYEIPFSAIAGQTVGIRVQSHILNTVPIDPLIVVLNQEGIPIAGDDDMGYLFDSALRFIAPSTADYTLLVSHAGGHHNGELDVTLTGIAWSADTFRMLAQQAIDVDGYARAVEMLNNAIALDGGTVNDYAKLAYVYKLLGDLDSAAVVLSQALQLDPMRADLRCDLGAIYVSWGDIDSGLAEFDRILANNPTDSCAWTHRDAIFQQHRDTNIETAVVQVVVAPILPSPADDLVALGHQFKADNRMFSAANSFLQALIVDPNHDEARCELGKVYLEWGNFYSAMRHFDTLIAKDSTNDCAITYRDATLIKMDSIFVPMTAQDFVDRAQMNYEIGDLEAAAQAYRTALSIDPLHVTARCHLGIVYAEIGDSDNALREWNIVLSQNAIDSCAWANRDALLAQLREVEVERSASTGASEGVVVDANDFIRQGDIFVQQNDIESAISAYYSALQLEPSRYDIRCRVGMLYVDLQDYNSAIREFDLVLSQDLSNHCARNHRRNAQRVLRDGPYDGDSASVGTSEGVVVSAADFIRQGDVFVQQNDIESAISAYYSALQLEPSRYDIRCRVGMLYVDLQDYNSAIREFDLILSQDVSNHCARNHRQNAKRVLLEGIPSANTPDIDALYNETLAIGVHALMTKAQTLHDAGDVWTASALLDRYIDTEYALVCGGELRWLSMEYREQGYTVFADMMLLKAIGDSSC